MPFKLYYIPFCYLNVQRNNSLIQNYHSEFRCGRPMKPMESNLASFSSYNIIHNTTLYYMYYILFAHLLGKQFSLNLKLCITTLYINQISPVFLRNIVHCKGRSYNCHIFADIIPCKQNVTPAVMDNNGKTLAKGLQQTTKMRRKVREFLFWIPLPTLMWLAELIVDAVPHGWTLFIGWGLEWANSVLLHTIQLYWTVLPYSQMWS